MAEDDAGDNDVDLAAWQAIALRGRRLVCAVDGRLEASPEHGSAAVNGGSAAPIPKQAELSVRAENVLKELAVELTGEVSPKGRWVPSRQLLEKLTFRHLLTARNCGPQTTDEIVRWAKTRGVVIQAPFHAGKSLSATWRDLILKFSTGEITKAEIAEALERSARRRNTRIPVAFQNILWKMLSSASE
jgi:hypothetical protein